MTDFEAILTFCNHKTAALLKLALFKMPGVSLNLEKVWETNFGEHVGYIPTNISYTLFDFSKTFRSLLFLGDYSWTEVYFYFMLKPSDVGTDLMLKSMNQFKTAWWTQDPPDANLIRPPSDGPENTQWRNVTRSFCEGDAFLIFGQFKV